MSPASGPAGGGNTVVITGSGFNATLANNTAWFGGVRATSAGVVIGAQSSALWVTAPAQAAGTYDITVTNWTSGETSVPGAGAQYTYLAAPTVTSVSPLTGPAGGGTTVTISGTGFGLAPATGAVTFGGTGATYAIHSDTLITATAPAGSGVVDA